MLSRLQAICDVETARVYFAAGVGLGAHLSSLNTLLTTIILLGTAIYTWRKALRRRPPGDDDHA